MIVLKWVISKVTVLSRSKGWNARMSVDVQYWALSTWRRRYESNGYHSWHDFWLKRRIEWVKEREREKVIFTFRLDSIISSCCRSEGIFLLLWLLAIFFLNASGILFFFRLCRIKRNPTLATNAPPPTRPPTRPPMRPALDELSEFELLVSDNPIAWGGIHFGSGQTPWLVIVPTIQTVPLEQLGEQVFAQSFLCKSIEHNYYYYFTFCIYIKSE